jgi:hypothetical protein
MSISSVINLGTVSPTITSVKLTACTNSSCTGGSVITGYDNVLVSTFPRTVSGIPDGTTHIKVEALGSCSGTTQCLAITGLPGTPTPTPTATGAPSVTPTPTPTATPLPIYTLQLGYDANEKLTACYNFNQSNKINVYSNTPFGSIGQGTVIYKNYTTPLSSPYADNGWYSDGTNTWIVYGGGSFNNQTSCNATPTPTPTATPLPGKGYLVSTGLTFSTISESCQQFESTVGQYGGQLFLNNIVNPAIGDQFYTAQDCNPSSTYSGNGGSTYYVVIRNDSENGFRKWAMKIGLGGTITELNLCS